MPPPSVSCASLHRIATAYRISHLVVREHLDCWLDRECPSGGEFDALRPVGQVDEDAFLKRAFGLALYDTSGDLGPGVFGRALTCLAAGRACELIEGRRAPSNLAEADAFVARRDVFGCQGHLSPFEERLWSAAIRQAKSILRNPDVRRRRLNLLLAQRLSSNERFGMP